MIEDDHEKLIRSKSKGLLRRARNQESRGRIYFRSAKVLVV